MDLPAGGDDVLVQRTPARIFSWLSEHRAPASTGEVATALGLHPNGVRRQLERMQEAGLLERSRSKGGRGRPGDLWAIAAGALPGGSRPSGYADLARWLARATPSGRTRLHEVEKSGRRIGRELAPAEQAEGPVEGFYQAVASLGFHPVLEKDTEDGFTCRLENCPYRDSVRENAAVVCALHRGITSGLLAQLIPDAKLVRFEAHDPEAAGCMVGVARTGGER